MSSRYGERKNAGQTKDSPTVQTSRVAEVTFGQASISERAGLAWRIIPTSDPARATSPRLSSLSIRPHCWIEAREPQQQHQTRTMPSLAAAVLAALTWTATATAAAASGHVYILDPSSSAAAAAQHDAADAATSTPTLSPVPARLVLAQRAGVEDYHSEDLTPGPVLDAINAFGLRTPMFASKEEAEKRRQIFVLVEGVEDAELHSPLSFALSPVPASTANRGLWVDLARQAQPSTYHALSDDEALERMTNPNASSPDHSDPATFHLATSSSALKDLLKSDKNAAYTILITTSSSTSSNHDDNTPEWGTYTLPAPSTQHPLLHKRTPLRPAAAEAPLEDTTSSSSVGTQASTSPLDAFASNNNSSTAPLPGILPACYPTLSACQSATANCSSHGTCTKKYSDNSASDQSRFRDCYTCACTATTSEAADGSGKKTTYWGGSACQKKDASVEFWMLALGSVGLVFLVGFAVGSVWEMGGEELPSVIGAGVSGPSGKR